MTYEEKLIKAVEWREDITKFLKDLFPHHFTKPFAPSHLEIFDFLKDHDRVAIAAPRKHGKSEIVSFGWVMYQLFNNPDCHFIIIISNNYANACKYLVPIKEEIEHNKLLKAVFGIQKSDKWSENEIELKCRKKVIVGGSDFKIRGQKYLQYRPDMIVIDDAEDDEMVRNKERRDDFEHWLLYSLDPAMTTEKNKIVVIGTILHRDSQLSKLLTGEGKYKDWSSKCYKALIENDTKALWSEGVSYEFLINEKLKDPYKFSQEYMNNPVPYEHAMFKEEYFDNYDEAPKDLIVNITVDLACTDKTYSDYTVILPVGIDHLGDLWVLPYIRGKYTDPDEIIDNIFKLYLKYSNHPTHKFGKLGIEKVAFQRFLLRSFEKERKSRGHHFPVVEIDAKGDKVSRISALQPFFAAGDIHVKSSMIELREELLDFPRARHDDVSDCLAMQLNFLNHKPVNRIFTDKKWKVTPEIQRRKFLGSRKITPRVYTLFKARF